MEASEPVPEDRLCSQCGEDLEDDTHHCQFTGECVDLCNCPDHMDELR